MSETKESTGKKPLKLKRPGKLELKKTVETGQVRQSFSHGRSKTVQVEVKRKRSFATEEAKETAQEVRGADGLTAEEREARARALQGAALRGDRGACRTRGPRRGSARSRDEAGGRGAARRTRDRGAAAGDGVGPAGREARHPAQGRRYRQTPRHRRGGATAGRRSGARPGGAA